MQIILLILTLLVVYQFKHFIADFIIQRLRKDGMAKFQETGWAFPLFKHVTDHGIGTCFIALTTLLYFDVEHTYYWAFGLALGDMVIHFTMDRIKASPNMLNRFKIEDWGFWLALGIDQMVHHLTHYGIITILAVLVLNTQ